MVTIIFDCIVFVFIVYWLTRIGDKYDYECMIDVILLVLVLLVYVGLKM
jgi:hypothetical protein